MSQYDEFRRALDARGQGRKTSSGINYRCPAHEDRTPSLRLKEGNDGRALVTCFAGCTFEAIRDALQLTETSPNTIQERNRPESASNSSDDAPKSLPFGDGIIAYHYTDADGNDLMVVIRRDTEQGKRISQWTPAGEGLWHAKALKAPRPLYNLPEIVDSKDRVIVVEGEKCADAALDAWPGMIVTTWAGGTNAWKQTDWEPLRGRSVSLIADGDKPGHKAMLSIARRLSLMGSVVEIALPPVDWDSDIADWIMMDGPDKAGERVRDLLQPYEDEETDDDDGADAPPPDIGAALSNNDIFRILGLVDADVAIAYSSTVGVFTRASLTRSNDLIGIAPLSFWQSVINKRTIARNDWIIIGDALIRIAEEYGQTDLTTLRGRGAWRVDGRIIYHLGDTLVEGDVESALTSSDWQWVRGAPISITQSATDEEMAFAAQSIMSYRWLSDQDGKRFLGWIVASLIGGALEWRPHAYLNAPTTAGKSWLLSEIVGAILGPAHDRVVDITRAALARLRRYDSLPVVIDEAESTRPWLRDILDSMRGASSGEGLRIRADGPRGLQRQSEQYCALLSGTALPRMAPADLNRFAILRLGRPVRDWEFVMDNIRAAMTMADAIRSRIIRHAGVIIDDAAHVTRELQRQGIESRRALMAGALTAGYQAWIPENTEIIYGAPESVDEVDAVSCIIDILSIVVPGFTNARTLLTILTEHNDHDLRQVADLYGIRWADDNRTALLIAPKAPGLTTAMTRTDWSDVDIAALLTQVDGIDLTHNSRRVGNIRQRVLYIPTETLDAMGVALDVDAVQEAESVVETARQRNYWED